jgi:RNA polymerase sigma factor (sigma-70 family)
METKNNFEEMMRKLSPTLRRITHKLNGHFTFFDEDDLFQEALEHLWLAFRDGTLGDKTDSYVLQGCYFHLKNYIRKTMDRAKLMSLSAAIDDDGSTVEDMLAYKDNSIEDTADSAILNDAIKVSALSEKEERVLSLSLEGMTVREIGQKIGVSHVMVIKIKSRIKEKCKALRIGHVNGYQS